MRVGTNEVRNPTRLFSFLEMTPTHNEIFAYANQPLKTDVALDGRLGFPALGASILLGEVKKRVANLREHALSEVYSSNSGHLTQFARSPLSAINGSQPY